METQPTPTAHRRIVLDIVTHDNGDVAVNFEGFEEKPNSILTSPIDTGKRQLFPTEIVTDIVNFVGMIANNEARRMEADRGFPGGQQQPPQQAHNASMPSPNVIVTDAPAPEPGLVEELNKEVDCS